MGTDRRNDGRVAARRLTDVVGSVGWVPRRDPLDDERDLDRGATGGSGGPASAEAPEGRQVPQWRLVRAGLLLALVVAVVLTGRAALTWWTTAPVAATVAAGAGHRAGGALGRTTTTRAGAPAAPVAGASGSASQGVPWPGVPGALPAGTGSGSGASPSAGPVVVDVVGRVRRPGLVRLAEGSRVADAVTAAGGAASGAALSRVNLARRLTDGEQVVIPGPNDPLSAVPGGFGGGGPGSAGAATGAGPVDLNTATEQQLDALPGVGPVTAGRIVAWRSQHSRFTRVDELGEVAGIGPKLLAQLRPLVRV